MSSATFLAVLALSAGNSLGATSESPTESYRGRIVREVRIEGEGAPAPPVSRELVELAPGDVYLPESVRRSIQQLFTLGVFSDIKVEAFPAGEQVDVLFRLFPRLEVASVEVHGLDGPGADLQDLRPRLLEDSGLHPGDALEVEAIGDAARRIGDRLKMEGYPWAEVEPEASFRSPRAVVVFHVTPGARAVLGSLEIEGVPPHVKTHVRRELGLSEGAPYSRRELDERIEALAAKWKELGYYGASIAVDERFSEPDRVALRLAPDLGPKVRIEVEGWELPEKELRKLVPLFTESRFTEDLVEESRANLEEHLVDRGYHNAEVSVERESLDGGESLRIRFLVAPGRRLEVGGIEIVGLHMVPESEIRALLATRSGSGIRSVPFREKTWQADVKEVERYLERRGFHRAAVETRERIDPTGEALVLVLAIMEGPRATVASIGLEGASGLDATTVLEAARIHPSDPFSGAEVIAARERIVTLYRDQGFRRAEVQVQTSLNDEGTDAGISFLVLEGERTLVDRVIFTGLRVTRESAIREMVTLRPGEPLSSVGLVETRQNLAGSGLFRSVEIEALPADPATGRSDVLVSVIEGPRTTFAYGFGYEEQQLARAEVEVTRRNLFGLNRSVSVFTRASFRGGRFITTYRQPEIFGFKTPAFVSLFAEVEDRTSFDYNRVGIGLQLSRTIGPHQNLLVRYRFDKTKIFRLEVDIDEIDRRYRNARISALSVGTLTDRRDDPLDPASGQFRILDLEWSAEALGTEVPYLKGLAQQFVYFRLPRNLVGAVGLRLGVGKLLSDRDLLLPIAERFFAGGATTLRGFALDQASPKQKLLLPNGTIIDGEPIGGNALALLNLELRFPLFGNLRGVVFSDNGNVYRSLEEMKFFDWRYNLGFGFRYDTPLGPLRVDYGFKLDRKEVTSIECPDPGTPCLESKGRFHVSLGHAF